MRVFLGIRCAASRGEAAVCDQMGNILLHLPLPPLALGLQVSHASMFSQLVDAVDKELSRAHGMSVIDNCQGLCVSASGLKSEGERRRLISALRHSMAIPETSVVCEDVWTEQATTGSCRGFLCLVSTGINAFVRAGTDSFSIGGWGSELSDLGGGYYIGRLAIRRVLDGLDGRRPVTSRFVESVLGHVGLVSAAQLTEWYAAIRRTPNWRAAVAGISVAVCRLSDAEQDLCATEILVSGAQEMQLSLLAAVRRGAGMFQEDEAVGFAISGGLALNCSLYQHAMVRVMRAVNNGYVAEWPADAKLELRLPKGHPICGVLAFAISGRTEVPPEPVQEKLAASARQLGLEVDSKLVQSLQNAN